LTRCGASLKVETRFASRFVSLEFDVSSRPDPFRPARTLNTEEALDRLLIQDHIIGEAYAPRSVPAHLTTPVFASNAVNGP